MKKLYLIFLSVFALQNTGVAQKLSVESFVLASSAIATPTTYCANLARFFHN